MNATEYTNDQITSPIVLERRLFAPGLPAFVATLGSFRGQGNQSLESILGDSLPSVLNAGLSTLSKSQLRALLDNSKSLLHLQDRIYEEGGEYWDALISQPSNSVDPPVVVANSSEDSLSLARPNAHVRQTDRPRSWGRFWQVLAAGILIAVGSFSYDAIRGLFSPDARNLIAFANPDNTAPLNDAKLLKHIADGMENLIAIDTSEQQFARRISLCHEACVLVMRTPGRLDEAMRREMVVACEKWLQDMASIAGSAAPLSNRTSDLNDLLEDISLKLRLIGSANDGEANV